LRLGDHWEHGGQWTRAAELYQHAIELDPLAESFYCRQMICMQAEDRRAEAARGVSPMTADSLGHARHLARAGNRIAASATAGDVTATSSPHDRLSALFQQRPSGSK